MFTRAKLLRSGIPEEKIDFYLDNYNYLANLQLLEGTPNEEKSNKPFDEWLDETYPNGTPKRDSYLCTNYIPSDIGLDFENFEQFIDKRKALMTEAFKVLIT